MAMSGGIDSTVAALMLHKEGYDVVGITMKTWDYATSVGTTGKKETGCCNLDSFNDARQAAVQHGFPHFILDIREEFGDFVIDNFVEEYIAGRTPNPDILCNAEIKFKAFLDHAMRLGADKIATGHYARVRQWSNDGRQEYQLLKAEDGTKDQSYFLHRLNQAQLSKTLFPVGHLYKRDVRKIAEEAGLPNHARKAQGHMLVLYSEFTSDEALAAYVRAPLHDRLAHFMDEFVSDTIVADF